MDTKPWIPFQALGLMAKTYSTENSFEIMFSDTIDLWEERLAESQLRATSSRLNTRFELDLEHVLRMLRECTEAPNPRAKYSVDRSNEDVLLLKIQVPMFDFQYVWEFTCKRANRTVLQHLLTHPLLLLTSELQRRITELKVGCDVLVE